MGGKPVQKPDESDDAFAIRLERFREQNRKRQRKCQAKKNKKSAEQKKELQERADRLENIVGRLEKTVSIQDSDQGVMNELREEKDGIRKLASAMDTTNHQVVEKNNAEHRANDQESEREAEIEELREGLDDHGSRVVVIDASKDQKERVDRIENIVSTHISDQQVMNVLREELDGLRQLPVQLDFMRGERAADRQLFVTMQTCQNESFKALCTALQTALQSSLQSMSAAHQTATTQQNASYRALIEGGPSALPPTINQVGNQVDVNQQVSFSGHRIHLRRHSF